MTHTVDTLMALADRYRDLKVGEGTAQTREALHTALTEAIQAAQQVWGPAEVASNRKAFKEYLADCEKCAIVPDIAGAFNAGWAAQSVPEPYDKTEMNAFAHALYDAKMLEGNHGHYETLFHVVHKSIEKARSIGGDN